MPAEANIGRLTVFPRVALFIKGRVPRDGDSCCAGDIVTLPLREGPGTGICTLPGLVKGAEKEPFVDIVGEEK